MDDGFICCNFESFLLGYLDLIFDLSGWVWDGFDVVEIDGYLL